jgi:hypothetical protein
LLALMSAFAPRFVFLVIWIARPSYVNSVFDTFIFPLLGLIFLPFTTLLYVFLAAPPSRVSGFEWLWIALAVVADLSHYAGAYTQRGAMRETPPRATPPPPA